MNLNQKHNDNNYDIAGFKNEKKEEKLLLLAVVAMWWRSRGFGVQKRSPYFLLASEKPLYFPKIDNVGLNYINIRKIKLRKKWLYSYGFITVLLKNVKIDGK